VLSFELLFKTLAIYINSSSNLFIKYFRLKHKNPKWASPPTNVPPAMKPTIKHIFFDALAPLLQPGENPSYASSLRSYLESYQTQYEVMVVLLECIEAWLVGDIIDPAGYPRICQRAITAQNIIGWHAFLQGYWTTEWSLLQDAHLKKSKSWTHKCSGRTWATRTITTLWNHIQTGWTIHNDAVHTRDAQFEDADLKKRAHFRITRLHQRQSETMAIHREYFFEDVDTTLRVSPLNFLRNWLNLYEPAILESIKMAKTESLRDTRPLSAHFPVTRPGVRPRPQFDNRLHTRHKGSRQRKLPVIRASQSTHRTYKYFTRRTSNTQPTPQRNSSTHIPQPTLPHNK
jgi:hypothetical protein